MQITKLGHCCLLIEHKNARILTDPGYYTTDEHTQINSLDAILITHEHPDHLHIESLKEIVKNNPGVRIITNKSVGLILEDINVKFEIVEHNQSTIVKDVLVEGFGEKHAVIYKTYKQVQNTGYFIDNELFYPGDALYDPGKQIKILALPVNAPWLKISEAIDYAKQLKPNYCFPVHDGNMASTDTVYRMIEMFLKDTPSEFRQLKAHKVIDLV